MIWKFLCYLFAAKNEHSLHSPFVFQLYTQVIRPKKTTEPPVFQRIETIRKQLLQDPTKIEVQDFGAGSRVNNSPKRSIRQITRNAEKPVKFARLLFRLVRHFKPNSVFDLGTSFGMTTAYLSNAKPDNQVFTFEGCPQTAAIAQQHFDSLGCQNIQLVVGNLDETLPQQVQAINQLDFAFFDANHRYEPTVRYFETCLAKATENSVFVFDDIHWSNEMEQAWQYIKAHQQVHITIDLFFVGLVFFRTQQPKQDFVLRF